MDNESHSPSKKHLQAVYLRWVMFVGLFVLISGITGSWLISTNQLFFPFYFSLYGSAGKVALFGLLGFFLFAHDQIVRVEVPNFSRSNLKWGVATLLNVCGFFFTTQMLFGYSGFQDAPIQTVVAHGFLLTSIVTAFFTIFSGDYLRRLFQKTWRMSLLCAGIAIAFYFLFGLIYQLWPYLSKLVLEAVVVLLKIHFDHVKVLPPLTIQLPQFSVTVGEYCSGIESLFLSTALYICLGILERKKIKFLQFAYLYLVLICGMFILNIVRVYIIILSGVWLSPEIAGKLFHTYLGIILFLTYFACFMRAFSPIFMILPSKREEKEI